MRSCDNGDGSFGTPIIKILLMMAAQKSEFSVRSHYCILYALYCVIHPDILILTDVIETLDMPFQVSFVVQILDLVTDNVPVCQQ